MPLSTTCVLPSRRPVRRDPCTCGKTLVLWFVALLLLAPGAVSAQAPDTTARPTSLPDTARSDARSVADLPIIGFPEPAFGAVRVDSLPTRQAAPSLERLLGSVPGTFLYDLGAVGWPHGWSVDGRSPQRARLWLHDVPYNDPITGRPRLDLLPVSFLERPGVGYDRSGTPTGIYAALRDVSEKRPFTEIRFRRNSNGLQNVAVLHQQQRRFEAFSLPTRLHVSFGYAGRVAENVYLGSRLDRERRLWGRVRWQTPRVSFEIRDVSSRHRVGAHGGVVPPTGFPFIGIYEPLLAAESVRNPNARRETYRNDLTFRSSGRILPRLAPAVASVTWTSNTNTFYADPEPESTAPDTTWAVKTHSYHGSLRQPLRLGRHRLHLHAQASLQTIVRGNTLQNAPARWTANAGVRDSLQWNNLALVGDLGGHAGPEQIFPTGRLAVATRTGPVHLSAEAGVAGQRLPRAYIDGFAGYVQPMPSASPGRLADASVTAVLDAGPFGPGKPFGTSVRVFGHRITSPVDLYTPDDPAAATSGIVEVRQSDDALQRIGATATFDWRRAARRGLYARGEATAQQVLNPETSALHQRVAATVPDIHGRVRLGARFVLFRDFITDLYVEGRGWTEMNSRRFHPPTGLFVVPPLNEPIPGQPLLRLGPSGTVDVGASAIFKGAKLYFTFSNVQANSNLQPGTLLVPVYPLPARQFRFGVSWPILN